MSKALCVMAVFVIILDLNTISTAGESEHELGLCSNMNRLILACPKLPCYVYLITCPLHVAATFDWKVCIEKTKKNRGQRHISKSSTVQWFYRAASIEPAIVLPYSVCGPRNRMSACKAYLIPLWLPAMGADSRV